MSGQHIIIEQLRADVERLRDDLSATEARLEVSYDAYERDCRDLRGKMTRAQTDRDHARLDRDSAIARAEKAERERDEAREALRVARTDRDREAHDRQTTSDAWNDMRRQRDAALVERNAAIEQAKHVGACLVECSARAEKAERERDEWKAKHDTLADVSRACIATTERERDARPDISAEDARAFMMFKPVPARDSREGPVMHALRAHAAKAVKP